MWRNSTEIARHGTAPSTSPSNQRLHVVIAADANLPPTPVFHNILYKTVDIHRHNGIIYIFMANV